MILRARIVLPVSRPAIEDGAVVIIGNRIVSVGRWSEVPDSDRQDVRDLGETILMPGLINAHCHLDYTDMAGQLPPQKLFSNWIKAIVALKAQCSYTDFAQSWLHGADMLLRTGTTTVADVEAVPELIPDMWSVTPLRVISFRELIGLKSRFAVGDVVESAVREWAALAGGTAPEHSVKGVGLSPHAPYSTTTELLQLAAGAAREHGWRLTTHVAESAQEFEMYTHGRGPLHDWLQSQRDMSDCGRGSPVQHLERCGYLSQNLLAVHVNYLGPDDATILAKREVSVVHCPRSHAYFGHALFPYRELSDSRINICLGTDSLASTLKTGRQLPELSMFAEMQLFAKGHPEISPNAVLRTATTNAAAALGWQGVLGELTAGALADLISIRFTGKPEEAEEAVMHHAGDVAGTMINGGWIH
jgi:cytosine/adenosine deaminase-related metal-dependent hydrolase